MRNASKLQAVPQNSYATTASAAAGMGDLMRRIFIGVFVLTCGIMLGCDKEIKEAVKPAPLTAPAPAALNA